nr:unnamed protein product [Callosobruchus chinensis]
MQTHCPKERLECTLCKKLGHSAEKCFRNKNNRPKSHEHKTLICDTQEKSKTNGYYVDCSINGYFLKGFIDSGCEIVTIRATDAKMVGLSWTESEVCLNGYGGATSKVLGITKVNLKVDLFDSDVSVYVVPDHLQTMAILIGRSILSNPDAITVVKNGSARLFSTKVADLPEIDELPTKITFRTKQKVEIPPHHVGFVTCSTTDKFHGDVFVDKRQSFQPWKEYVIPSCVTSTKAATIPILNISESTLTFDEDQVFVRGIPCKEEDMNTQVSVNKINVLNLPKFTMNDLKSQISNNLSQNEFQKLLLLLNKYRDGFAQNMNELGKIKGVEMKINLTDDKPVTYRPYRLSFSEREKVREIVNSLMSADIIQESNSPYASPVILVKKKNDETRMCIDFRAINAKTIKDSYPLPRVDDHLEVLKGCKFFTTLDMASGYHQIPMAEESRQKTAFVTPDGQYEYLRMPFGLVNAPAMFQRTINKILGTMRFTTALAYMDDVLVPSVSFNSGLIALGDVLETFREAGVTLRLEKCKFFQANIGYLGHEISAGGTRPGTAKIEAVKNFPTPKNVHNVRQFVGLCSYFRKYVKAFAQIAQPLTSLTKRMSHSNGTKTKLTHSKH